MSRKNNDKSQDEEIWSKRFAEDHQELEYVSRSQRSRGAKSNEDGMSPMLAGTVIFLAVIIIGMIFYYLWYSNYLNRPSNEATDPEDDRIETVQNDEETEDPDTEDTNEGSEDQNADSNTETEPEPEPQPDPQPQPEPQPEPQPQPEPEPEPEPQPTTPPSTEGRTTYTVQAGDNMYRIALNNGMTTQELMALNGLTEETVYVGQVLIVE